MIATYDIIEASHYDDIVAQHWHDDIVVPQYRDKQINYIHHLAAPVMPTH